MRPRGRGDPLEWIFQRNRCKVDEGEERKYSSVAKICDLRVDRMAFNVAILRTCAGKEIRIPYPDFERNRRKIDEGEGRIRAMAHRKRSLDLFYLYSDTISNN